MKRFPWILWKQQPTIKLYEESIRGKRFWEYKSVNRDLKITFYYYFNLFLFNIDKSKKYIGIDRIIFSGHKYGTYFGLFVLTLIWNSDGFIDPNQNHYSKYCLVYFDVP